MFCGPFDELMYFNTPSSGLTRDTKYWYTFASVMYTAISSPYIVIDYYVPLENMHLYIPRARTSFDTGHACLENIRSWVVYRCSV